MAVNKKRRKQESKKNQRSEGLAGLISLPLLIVAAFFLDGIFFGFTDSIKSQVLDRLMEFVSNDFVLIVLVFSALVFFIRNSMKESAKFAITVLTTYASVFLMKLIIARPRPVGLELSILGIQDYSFPSMHTAIAFCTAGLLANQFKRQSWLIFLIASMIGFSRIYLEQHYLSDVFVGALLGYFIATYLPKILEKFKLLDKLNRIGK